MRFHMPLWAAAPYLPLPPMLTLSAQSPTCLQGTYQEDAMEVPSSISPVSPVLLNSTWSLWFIYLSTSIRSRLQRTSTWPVPALDLMNQALQGWCMPLWQSFGWRWEHHKSGSLFRAIIDYTSWAHGANLSLKLMWTWDVFNVFHKNRTEGHMRT